MRRSGAFATVAVLLLLLLGAGAWLVAGDGDGTGGLDVRGGPDARGVVGNAGPDVRVGPTEPDGAPEPRRRRAAAPEGTAPADPDAPAAPRSIRGEVVEFARAVATGSRSAHAPPPPGAEVVILRTPEPTSRGVVAEVASEVVRVVSVADDGSFEAIPPGPGVWTVVARAPGKLGFPQEVLDGATVVRLELSTPPPLVTFRVRAAPRGERICGASVIVGRLESLWEPPETTDVVPRVVVVTDERGEARVGVAPGEGAVVIADRFATMLVESVGDETEDVWLRPGDRIEGVVLDLDGRPIAGADVVARTSGDLARWTTDAAGRFRLDGIDVSGMGGVLVSVAAKGVSREDALVPGTLDAVIVLGEARGDVAGVVLLPDGRPAAGARLSGGRATGADGRFRTSVPIGRSTVLASLPGVGGEPELRGSAEVDVTRSATTTAEIRLAPAPRSYVAVRVVDAEGRRVAGARIGVHHGVKGPPREDAEVLVTDVPPGTQLRTWFQGVEGQLTGWEPFEAGETVTSGTPDDAPHVVRLPPLTRLVVTAEFDGEPLPLARYEFAQGPAPGEARIGIGLRYSFVSVTPTEMAAGTAVWHVDSRVPLVVCAQARGYATMQRAVTESEIAAGKLVVRFGRGATVTARIVAPDPDAEVGDVSLVRRGVGHEVRVLRPDRMSDEGVAFDLVEPGPWSLVVRWPANLPAVTRDFDVTGAALDLGDIAVPAPVRIRGTVLLADGRPGGGAVVRLLLGDVVGAIGDEAPVRSDGTFAFDVPPGLVGTFVVRRAGSGAVAVAASPSAPVRVVLPRPGKLDVRVRLGARRRTSWSVHVRDPATGATWQPETYEDAYDPAEFDAVRRFRDLAPGPVTVVASGIGWDLEATAVVVAGETTVVVLE